MLGTYCSRNFLKIKPVHKFKKCDFHLNVSEEVRSALYQKKPVVALESTIVTHGMPYPKNIECAKEVEDIVRGQGAIPATVAIIKGQLKMGLTDSEINELGDVNISKPVKTSRRDLAYVISKKLNGGTTVSGTLIAAKKAGIPIFATGGIGGVHRGAEQTFDISADLIELGKSNVAVISSGVKSILDIPKTLEYLETHGVFVATFGDSKIFPAFYSRDSDYSAPYNVKTPEEAARIIKSSKELDLGSAMLFAVPVPEEFSLKSEEIDAVIEQALYLAKTKYDISGKEITPFLLAQVAKLTEGRSLKTNIALIKNNAETAAKIAVALSKLQENPKVVHPSAKKPFIIGGSNLDCNAVLDTTDLKLDGRIHFGKFAYQAGGVARNLCENLYKLGFQADFLTALGNDDHGKRLKKTIPEDCRDFVNILENENSAQCITVFDGHKECLFLMGDMDIHQKLTPELVKKHEKIIKTAPMIIFDGNLTIETMETILEIAGENKIPGLWEVCFVNFEDFRHHYDNKFTGCWWVFEEEYYIIHDFLLPGFFIATQFFFTLCMTLVLIAAFLTWMYCFCSRDHDKYLLLLLSNGANLLIAGFCGLLAVIIFGANGDNRDWMPYWQHNDLSWSFAFGVIGSLLLFPAGCLFLVEARRARYRKLQASAPPSHYSMEVRKPAHTDI